MEVYCEVLCISLTLTVPFSFLIILSVLLSSTGVGIKSKAPLYCVNCTCPVNNEGRHHESLAAENTIFIAIFTFFTCPHLETHFRKADVSYF